VAPLELPPWQLLAGLWRPSWLWRGRQEVQEAPGVAGVVALKFHSLEIPLEGLELLEGMQPALGRMVHRFFQTLALELELDLAQEWPALVLHLDSWPVGGPGLLRVWVLSVAVSQVVSLVQEVQVLVPLLVLVLVSLVGVVDLVCYRSLHFWASGAVDVGSHAKINTLPNHPFQRPPRCRPIAVLHSSQKLDLLAGLLSDQTTILSPRLKRDSLEECPIMQNIPNLPFKVSRDDVR